METHRRLKTYLSGKGGRFFLQAIIRQSRLNSKKANDIINLYNQKKEKILFLIPSAFAIKVVDTLFRSPIFTKPNFIKMSAIPKDSAYRILRKLQENRIITEITTDRKKKSPVLVFKKLLEIIKI